MSLGVTSVCFLLWRRFCCLFFSPWVERGADLRHAPLAAVFDIWCSSATCGACVLERIRRPVPFAVAAELPRCSSGAVSEIFYGMLLLHLIYMRVAMVPQLFDVLLGCGHYEVWCLLFLDEHTRCSGCCGSHRHRESANHVTILIWWLAQNAAAGVVAVAA